MAEQRLDRSFQLGNDKKNMLLNTLMASSNIQKNINLTQDCGTSGSRLWAKTYIHKKIKLNHAKRSGLKSYVPWRNEINERFSFIIKISHLSFTYLHLLFSFSDNSKHELHPVNSGNVKDHSIFSYTVDRKFFCFCLNRVIMTVNKHQLA